MRRMVAAIVVAASVVTLRAQNEAKPAAPAQEPVAQGPTFKTGVEVVTIDVGVTDDRGRPVRDLRAAEFHVKVDGKPRRVVSAQHVMFDVEAQKKIAAAGEETFFTTNIGPPTGRMILIAVDQANIRPGAVRQLLKTAAAFVDKLSPTDQVAFVVYPAPGPEVGFTTNHLRVKQAMAQVVGNQQTFQGKFNIGITEALAIHERGDETTMKVVISRECGVMRRTEADLCSREVQAEAAELTQHIRQEANISLQGLQLLLRRLAVIDGQKSLILLSEGLVIDDIGSDADEVARLAAIAHASVNVLLMDVPRADVTQALLPPTPTQDRALQMKGLEDLAAMSRGTLFQVLGTGQSAFERLTSELSGYYVIGVEEAPEDRNGKRHRLDVEIGRKGMTLRSHRAFVLSSAAETAARKPSDRLIEALNSPFAVAELPLRITNFAFQDPEKAGKVRVVLAAEIGQAGTQPAEYTVGFILFDDQGRAAASGEQKRRLERVDGRDNAPLEYLATAAVDPGTYTLRFGVVDAQGRRGSVVREVQAWKTTGEVLAAGDLMIGNVLDRGKPVQPQVEPRIHDNHLGTYVELYAAERQNFVNTGVALEIAEEPDSPALVSQPAEYFGGAFPTTIIAQATLNTAVLPPGRYVVRARISREEKPIGVLVRPFILEPSAAAVAAAATVVKTPTNMVDWVPKFERAAVLKPEVIASMLDLAQRSAPALKDAMTEARAGRFGSAALEALNAGDQTTAAFLKGLELLTKGQLDQAANQFNTATGPRREHFPSAFYLGVCYAAAGRDLEAASVWQMALGSDPRPPLVYALFADARFRANQPASVIDVLRPFREKAKGDDAIAKRLGVAYVMTANYTDALPILDDYLVRHPTDQEALFSAVLAQYEITSTAGVPLSNVARAKLAKYAKAYTGPQKPLVGRYVAALEAR